MGVCQPRPIQRGWGPSAPQFWCYICLISNVNKDWTCKDKDKDQAYKDQDKDKDKTCKDKDKDLTHKDQDKDEDLNLFGP